MGKPAPCQSTKAKAAKVHLKQGHEPGTKFKTPWQQLSVKLKTKSCSPQDLQSSFDVLQEFRPEDVAKLSAASKRTGGQTLDCRKAFFVQGRKSVPQFFERGFIVPLFYVLMCRQPSCFQIEHGRSHPLLR